MPLIKYIAATLFIATLGVAYSECPAQLRANFQLVYHQYTVDNGLPSNEVYQVFQDSKGYIWFATSNGVSRFDGTTFQNFDMSDGLVDNIVFEVYEDYKGRVWFIPYTCLLCYYENGEIKEYAYNQKIKNHVRNVLGPVKMSFRVDSLDNVLLSVKRFGVVTISAEGAFRVNNEGVYDMGDVVIDARDGSAIISYVLAGNEYNLVYIDNDTITYYGKKTCGREYQPFYLHQYLAVKNDSTFLLSVQERLYQICSGRITRIPIDIDCCIWLSIDRAQNLWVSNYAGGVRAYPNADATLPASMSLFADSRISSVLQDNEGAYWFTSLSDGVFYVPNHRVSSLSNAGGLQSNRIRALLAQGNELYVGYQKNLVDILSKDKISSVSISGKCSDYSVKSLRYDSTRNVIWVCGSWLLGVISNRTYTVFYDKLDGIDPRKIIKSRGGGYWIGETKGLSKMDENGRIVYRSLLNSGFVGDIYSLVEDCSGAVWFCTINGLWRWNGVAIERVGEGNKLLSVNSHSMFIHPKDSSLWIATNGLGVVVRKQDGQTINITKKHGLKSNTINRLLYTKKGVWAATASGLSVITKTGSGGYTAKTYGISDGLPSNNITSVAVDGNLVYAASSEGLVRIDLNTEQDNAVPPPAHITAVSVDGKNITPISNSSSIELSHSHKMLNISYVALAYKYMGRVNYRYRMINVDSAWVYTTTTNCLYAGLKPGNYTFQVQGQNSSGLWSLDGGLLKITVMQPYWQTMWFLVLLSLLVAGIIFAIFKLIIISINKRNMLIHSANMYKQHSLRQQMNPHFIFNTLGSIQYYILNKDTLSSHRYLTKFADLMRMTLDNSFSLVVSLNEEIKSLKLYLELEALRLDGKFTYSVNCETFDEIKNFMVPALLMQPFVENSIWHGIMLKPSQDGHVEVNIKDDPESIVITISDNGVGRVEARRIREKNARAGHKSRGYQITQERIALLNTIYGDKFNITTTDSYSSTGEPLGTQVVIVIPKGVTFDNIDFNRHR